MIFLNSRIIFSKICRKGLSGLNDVYGVEGSNWRNENHLEDNPHIQPEDSPILPTSPSRPWVHFDDTHNTGLCSYNNAAALCHGRLATQSIDLSIDRINHSYCKNIGQLSNTTCYFDLNEEECNRKIGCSWSETTELADPPPVNINNCNSRWTDVCGSFFSDTLC